MLDLGKELPLPWICLENVRDNYSWMRRMLLDREFGFDLLQEPDRLSEETL